MADAGTTILISAKNWRSTIKSLGIHFPILRNYARYSRRIGLMRGIKKRQSHQSCILLERQVNRKGVPQTFANHYASSQATALSLEVDRSDCWICCVPLYHISGLSIFITLTCFRYPSGSVAGILSSTSPSTLNKWER